MTVPEPPRNKCRISWLRAHLPTEEVEALEAFMAHRGLNNYQVADALSEETGVPIDYQVIQRHRIGRCATCNREAEHEPVQATPATH